MLRFAFVLFAFAFCPVLASEDCEEESFDELAKRVQLTGPLSLADAERRYSTKIVEELKSEFRDGDQFYVVWFITDPNSGDFWGYNSLVLIRNDCVVAESYLEWIN